MNKQTNVIDDETLCGEPNREEWPEDSAICSVNNIQCGYWDGINCIDIILTKLCGYSAVKI